MANFITKLFGHSEKPKPVIVRIDVEEKGTPKFLFSHYLSLENFREYNMAVSKDSIAHDKKLKRIWGILLLAIAVGFAVLGIIYRGDSYALQTYIVATILFASLGMYTICFYRFFFEKKLEKGSLDYYTRSKYLQNEITLALYEEGVLEKAAPRDAFFSWEKFQRCWRSENLIYLEFNLANQLMIAERSITSAGFTVEEIMSFCNEHIEAAKAAAENGGDEDGEEYNIEEVTMDADEVDGDRSSALDVEFSEVEDKDEIKNG